MLRLAWPCKTLQILASRTTPRSTFISSRTMANVREDSIPHVVRTAHEQRQAGVWNATVSQIDEVNSSIRLIRLGIVGAAVGASSSPVKPTHSAYTPSSNHCPKSSFTIYRRIRIPQPAHTIHSPNGPISQASISTSPSPRSPPSAASPSPPHP